MRGASVQKERGEETPVFAENNDPIRFESAELMQYFGIIPIADKNFQQERGDWSNPESFIKV